MRAGTNWRPRPKTAPTWKHGRRSVTGFMKKPAPTARRGRPKHAPCAGEAEADRETLGRLTGTVEQMRTTSR